MKKTFYIFRHGQTNMNLERRWQGQKFDVDLNDTGIKQARDLANELEKNGIEVIYTSPFKRAKQTAEIVADRLHVEVIIDDDLKEGCFGVVEGKTSDEIKQIEEFEPWYRYDKEGLYFGFPEGETKEYIAARFRRVLENLLKKDHDVVGICAHAGIFLWFAVSEFSKRIKLENGRPYKLTYENGKWIEDVSEGFL